MLILFSLGTLGISVFQSTSSTLVERQDEFNSKILRMADLYISNLYKKMTEYTDLVYGNPEVQRILNSDWNSLSELEKFRSLRVIELEFFLPMIRANKEFDSIWVLREGAQSFGSSQFTLRDAPFVSTDLPWFQSMENQQAQQFHWIPTRPAEFDLNKNPVFSVARWVPNLKISLRGPRYLGVVVLNINVEALEKALNLYSSQVDDGGHMFIIDAEGRVVAHPDRDFVGADWSGTVLFQKILLEGNEGRFMIEGSGNRKEMISHFKTETTGWQLVTVTPQEAILADIQNLGIMVIILTFMTLIIAAALASLISSRISRPIQAMKNMMAQVEDGDLSARYHTRSEHEIGQLSRSLNRMMDDLEQKTDNLLELDRMKDEFLASTSHELRTPLNGIMGITEFLMDGGAGTTTPALSKNLSIILNSSRRLASLVSDILDFSRIKNHKLELQRSPLNLQEMLSDALEILHPLFHSKSINLSLRIPDGFPAVFADPNRLEQIFLNLIGNSLKFTDKGSITISATMTDNLAQISVSDTGIGIPTDKLEAIFNEFEQVDASAARNYGGTGLGLSITKKFVELHGGQIWCESTLGQGSTFYFTLPISDKLAKPRTIAKPLNIPQTTKSAIVPTSENQEKQTYENSPSSVRHRILAVDDEPVNLQVLSNHLGLHNYEVVLAVSGAEALKILESDLAFDLIILDIMMPRITGLEVCREVRGRFNLMDMPILLLTAKNQPSDVIAGFEAGANDYLVKPFDKSELLARTKTMVTLKNLVRTAVSSAETLESERRQRQLAETLRSANNRLSSSLQTEDVLTTLLEAIQGLVTFDTGAAYLHERGELKLVGSPLNGRVPPELKSFPWSEEQILEVHNSSLGYLFIPDLNAEDTPAPLRFSQESLSSLVLPLYFHDTLEGILVLESTDSKLFDERRISLVLTLISQAVISLENARLFEDVKKMADIDALTEINNRRHFLALAERELKLARRNRQVVALMLFDVDHFKRFNDTYGHDTGDLVLKTVAQTAKEALRETDIIGRFGGEEFVILLPPQSELEQAHLVAERVRATIESAIVTVPYIGELKVTVSLGLTTTEKGVYTLADLIKLADEAMYEAKKQGRNRIVFRNVKGT